MAKISEIKPIFDHSLKNEKGKLSIVTKDLSLPNDKSGDTFTADC